MNTLTDSEIGIETEAFETIALPLMDSVYRVALYMVGNESDAEDLVQDTYLRAYKFFDKFRNGTNCKAWLLKIMRNTFINSYYRNKKHLHEVYFSENEKFIKELSSDITPEDEIFEDLLDDDITAAINALPDNLRAVVLLADMENLSYKEISDIIGNPIGTIMSRLHRGRRLLRKSLKDYTVKHRLVSIL